MSGAVDVVVVGGGIAGASLASALAGEGLGVTVLEATVEFPDRVRGESMQAWGVSEARRLGVEDVLIAAGAHVTLDVAAVLPEWRRSPGHPDEPHGAATSPARSTCATPMRARRSSTRPLRPAPTVVRGVSDVERHRGLVAVGAVRGRRDVGRTASDRWSSVPTAGVR